MSRKSECHSQNKKSEKKNLPYVVFTFPYLVICWNLRNLFEI